MVYHRTRKYSLLLFNNDTFLRDLSTQNLELGSAKQIQNWCEEIVGVIWQDGE